jgi:hypothetical protein
MGSDTPDRKAQVKPCTQTEEGGKQKLLES